MLKTLAIIYASPLVLTVAWTLALAAAIALAATFLMIAMEDGHE